MRLVDDVTELPLSADGAFCVLARAAESELAVRAAELLGLAHGPGSRSLRRPALLMVGEETHLLMFTLEDGQRLAPVRISVSGGGAMIIADDSVLSLIHDQLADASEDLWPELIRLLIRLAHTSQDHVERMIDASHQLEKEARGFVSAPQRREMGRLRDRLFEIYEVQESQSRLLAPEEELAQSLGNHERHLLARASHAFDTVRSMGMQLYARLGDVLTQQGTIVSERLTIVATVILPLTLATGFFGMNFGWLTERIGSLTAFIVLGLVIPAALVFLALALTRHITRSS